MNRWRSDLQNFSAKIFRVIRLSDPLPHHGRPEVEAQLNFVQSQRAWTGSRVPNRGVGSSWRFGLLECVEYDEPELLSNASYTSRLESTVQSNSITHTPTVPSSESQPPSLAVRNQKSNTKGENKGQPQLSNTNIGQSEDIRLLSTIYRDDSKVHTP
ncbi:hypothetical protein CROQUDRAFT_406556 [Cronartium quercuum f. sp. fusiforme G11]|uniref:Uncharacterized protein n=1 Tax=Cronartium quercuum f. sp. fusiforme G11 TaxID=708437 RepID=A0A9P6NRF4_9BASI|nr:hypothetical protein CROQUDRAFT_406556 [Cronartium quercuum f. sp. fusiforme G11]